MKREPPVDLKLIQYANTLLKDRMLFGSDFPPITPERWMKEFDEASFKDKVKPLILKDNAMRLRKLGPYAVWAGPRSGPARTRQISAWLEVRHAELPQQVRPDVG